MKLKTKQQLELYLRKYSLKCSAIQVEDEKLKEKFLNAIKDGNLDLVKTLIELNNDLVYTVDPVNSNEHYQIEQTALHWAAKRGYHEIITFLLSHNADVNAADVTGKTPLMVAMRVKQGKSIDVKQTHIIIVPYAR